MIPLLLLQQQRLRQWGRDRWRRLVSRLWTIALCCCTRTSEAAATLLVDYGADSEQTILVSEHMMETAERILWSCDLLYSVVYGYYNNLSLYFTPKCCKVNHQTTQDNSALGLLLRHCRKQCRRWVDLEYWATAETEVLSWKAHGACLSHGKQGHITKYSVRGILP